MFENLIKSVLADQVLSIFPPDALVPLKLSVIISSPHFLYADNSTIHSVRGLNPVQTEHETYINVHMDTGVVVKAAKRLQFNTILSQNKATDKLDCLKNLTKHWSQLMPIFWAEEVSCDVIIHLLFFCISIFI